MAARALLALALCVAPAGADAGAAAGAAELEQACRGASGGGSACATAPVEFSLVADCGGVGDGVTLNDAAWAACLAKAASVPAGTSVTVAVPAGDFVSGPFNITRDDFSLLLAPNATLRPHLPSDFLASWPLILPLPSLGRCREYATFLRYAAFITVWNATRVAVSSNATVAAERGTLDGGGPLWWLARKVGTLQNDPGGILEFMYSSFVSVDNVQVLNSPYWHIHPFASDYVTVTRSLVSSSHDGPETDGIDPDSSRHVLIEDCVIDTGDDAIAVKAGWDEPGLTFNRSSNNVTVRDTVLSTGANAFCMGSEMSGGVYDVHCLNCTCFDVDVCFRLKSALGRGGFIDNISMTDTTIVAAKKAIDFSDYYGGHPGPVNASLVPRMGGATARRMRGTLVEAAGGFDGLAQANVTGVVLEDVALDAPAGSWACSNVTGGWHNVTPPLTGAACAGLVEQPARRR